MLRGEPTNNHTAGIDTNHSTMITLLLKLTTLCVNNSGYSSNCIIVPAVFLHLMAKYTLLANLWNRITIKIFDIFRIITLKQQKFSQSDPVLIRPKLASVLIESDPVLIRSHLFRIPEWGEHGQDQDWISSRILAIFLGQDWIWIFIFEKKLDQDKIKIFVWFL